MRNFDTMADVKNENDFMYGAEDILESVDDSYEDNYKHGSVDSNGSIPKKLRLRQLKNKRIKVVKNTPTKYDLYMRAREKGVTIDYLSYDTLQKYKQKVFNQKQQEEIIKEEYGNKMDRQEKFLRSH